MHHGALMMRRYRKPAARPVKVRGAYTDAQPSLKNATTGATDTPVPSGVGGAAG